MTSGLQEELRRRQYANPPIAEAIARLHWDEPIAWKATTPGVIYGLLEDLYPDEPQVRNVVEAQVSGELGGPSNLELRSGPQQMMFSRESGSRLVMVGPNDIAVHGLRPYEGWESLEARLFEALTRVGAWARPVNGIYSTVALRYINRIEVPEASVEFADWLTVAFALPPGLPQTISGFLDRIDAIYPDGKTRIAFTWASTESSEGSSAFILDFDLSVAGHEASLDSTRADLQELKLKEGQAFEGLLRDTLRELFGEL